MPPLTSLIRALYILGASMVVQTVKHLPAMQETWVQSLGQEDPLEKEMATHSSTLAWKIPWMEEPGGLQSMGSQRSPGEGNGNPPQYYCLENPIDGGAWWSTVHGVTKSWARLSDFTFKFQDLQAHVCPLDWKKIIPEYFYPS